MDERDIGGTTDEDKATLAASRIGIVHALHSYFCHCGIALSLHAAPLSTQTCLRPNQIQNAFVLITMAIWFFPQWFLLLEPHFGIEKFQ